MTTETDVVNLALTILGESRIASLTEATKPAQDASAIFTAVRDELMSRYNWTFAIKRGQAPLNATPPAFGFDNAFDFPSDCLRVVRPGSRYAGPDLTDYRSGPTEEYSIEGRKILTDWPPDGTNATGNADKVVAINIVTAGFSFIGRPTLTIAAPPAGGVQATGVAYLGVYGVKPNAAIPGSGYTYYDLLTLQGGTPRTAARKATFTVIQGLGVAAPFRYDVVDPGEYSAMPGVGAAIELASYRESCATTGGLGGPSAQVDTWWRVSSTEITNPGSGYLVPPIVTVGGGFGVNYSFSTTLGDFATSYLDLLYVARIEDPNLWDAYFVKLLAAQLALDLCESLTESTTKRTAAMDYFNRIFKSARDNNAIQQPPKKLPDDEWLVSRL